MKLILYSVAASLITVHYWKRLDLAFEWVVLLTVETETMSVTVGEVHSSLHGETAVQIW